MRTPRSRALALATIFTVLPIAGCGDSSGSQSSTVSSTPAQAPARRATPQKGPVPRSLGQVESGAEDTIDHAHAGDRAEVVSTTRRLARAARGRAAADLRKAGVAAPRIADLLDRTRLLRAIAARADFARVSLAANRISELMPEFYARFRNRVPPNVLKLDYLDREAQLRSLAGDQTAVAPAVKKLSATWAGLRARVVRAGGKRVAREYSAHVTSMRRLARGTDAEALQQEAARGLELVDALERQFAR
jgi:hypothetical protein